MARSCSPSFFKFLPLSNSSSSSLRNFSLYLFERCLYRFLKMFWLNCGSRFLLVEYSINLFLILSLSHVVIYQFKFWALLSKDLKPVNCWDVLHRAFLRVQLGVRLYHKEKTPFLFCRTFIYKNVKFSLLWGRHEGSSSRNRRHLCLNVSI